jgi:Domain of unknown function (DUF892)
MKGARAHYSQEFALAPFGLCWPLSASGPFRLAALLQETLDEERATNEKLTELAEGMVNAAAERDGEE